MSQKLKETIDKMVEDSIRKILPQVMNEVLLKTIASAGVMTERRVEKPAYPYVPDYGGKKVKATNRPRSLDQILDPGAGSDFYQTEAESPAPGRQVIAQRIQSLPPQLRGLAEGMDMDDDGGEMWEDDSIVPSAGSGPPLAAAAARAGLDFSKMKQAIRVGEAKKRIDGADMAAKAQFEEARLKRLRENLNGGKPVE